MKLKGFEMKLANEKHIGINRLERGCPSAISAPDPAPFFSQKSRATVLATESTT